MFKKFTPTYVARNVYEIDINKFEKLKVKCILCDLDNTLDAYYQKKPSPEALEFYKRLKEKNIELILTSNNTKSRVSKYAEELGVEYTYSCRKPLTGRVKKLLKTLNYSKSDYLIIGDQVFTDVLFANKLKIRSILCDNLVSKDQFFTKINKFFDKYIRRYLKKHNKLTNWREI